MKANVIKLPIRQVTKDLTIKVKLTGAAAFGWRVKLGAAMVALAALITGLKFETSWEHDSE